MLEVCFGLQSMIHKTKCNQPQFTALQYLKKYHKNIVKTFSHASTDRSFTVTYDVWFYVFLFVSVVCEPEALNTSGKSCSVFQFTACSSSYFYRSSYNKTDLPYSWGLNWPELFLIMIFLVFLKQVVFSLNVGLINKGSYGMKFGLLYTWGNQCLNTCTVVGN